MDGRTLEEQEKDIHEVLRKVFRTPPKSAHRLPFANLQGPSSPSWLYGHETTASMLTWMMWELAKDEEYQGQMRDEIAAMRGPRLYAIRLPAANNAGRDDVIPLSTPVQDESGSMVSDPRQEGHDDQHIDLWIQQVDLQRWPAV
ncbi:hypothetical protein C8Q72DRAFT_792828 [Fomitopsis betulina]|nr:hypothetical protein C8Q72DRAFT_792828 [Fomitopsis betulina]